MRRLIFLYNLLFFICMANMALAQKNKPVETIWNNVLTGYVNASSIDVTKVVMYEDKTEVSLHVDYVAGQWIRIAKETFLQTSDGKFPIRESSLFALGEQYMMPDDQVDFVLTFEPVAKNTKAMDLVEPGGWVITNIHNADVLPEGIVDTYWRNEATGDWYVGFSSKNVVYGNKVWDIVSQKEKNDVWWMTLADPVSGSSCDMMVGKMKKGKRTITIGKQQPIVCSPITSGALPDYPAKDTGKGFCDNGYALGDSATFIGWLKDMPQEAWGKSKEFEVSFENIMTNKQESAYAKMDSLGRFSFKMPLLNSSEVFIDWGRSTVSAFLEPGKTYFFLYDFKTGQKLWMGDDVRVQNELLSHPRSRSEARLDYENHNLDLMDFWAKSDSARLVQMAHLEEMQHSHPALSQRYVDYLTDYYRMIQGRNMMQARYYAEDRKVPQEYLNYVGQEFWKTAPKPYTLYRDFIIMNNDFLMQIVTNKGGEDLPTLFYTLEKKGKVELTPVEKNALDNYVTEISRVQKAFEEAETEEERKSIVEEFNESEMVTVLNALVQRNQESLMTHSFQQVLDVVDSIGCDRNLRDIILAQRLYQQIDASRQPIEPVVMEFAQQQIKMSAALDIVKNLNDKYLAIKQRDISNSSSLKTVDDVKDMSDGEAILRKIIEPYKGHIILLDIWGTWCGPCKEALSHSAEEYERLAPYDMVFLYLANNSSDESWKNIIKEYDVLGDNVVHYNLPADQQSAVEHFLNVNAFPTYKLIDRNGSILDVNADPRNLDRLESLLKSMK